MLMIRLRRIGKKKHPTYRFIVSEKQKDTKGDFLEDLGHYDPHTQPSTVELKKERVQHWLRVGAQPSETVHNLLVDQKLIEGKKVKAWAPKKKKDEEKTDGEVTAGKKVEEDSKPEGEKKESADKTKEGTEEKKEEKPTPEVKKDDKASDADKDKKTAEKKE